MSDEIPGQSGGQQGEEHATLFAHLILQQSNMAMMLMGKVPNPQSGETMKDLESARFFIDTLEMLETKTKGNLTKEESGLLKQSLMTLRMGYVEAVNEPSPTRAETEQRQTSAPSPQPEAATPSAASPLTGATEEEHRTKFSKKY